ncbi:MAG: D-alanyl-D-alanine carboxypeptidase, partial [Syntrophomonadaceae bacterium]|nr:D-alanyl-D-alanine carboxypeptidase [Syntrophomonadaceae bacterium]
ILTAGFPVAAEGPYVGSKYYCLMDAETGQVIISKNMEEIRQVASTTKMLTAILTMEYADLNEIAEVSQYADHTPEFTIGLRAGQKVAVGELLKVSLIRSSNDAAVVLAEHVAGNEELFAHLMSKKAFASGAMVTHFRNASGLPDNEHYSTAYDLAQIGRYALSDPTIKKLVATRQSEFKHPGYLKPLTINNTNGLLGSYPGADGIKTGTANAAGKCLVASASRQGRQLIAVVLKSPDRNGDCIRLLDYGFKQSTLSKVVDHSLAFKNISISNGEESGVDVYPAEDLELWISDKGPDVEKRVKMDYELAAPVSKGQKVGIMEVYCDGKKVRSIDLICGQKIDKKGNLLFRIVKDHWGQKEKG